MLLDCLAGHSMLYGFPGETKVLPYFIDKEVQYGDLADDRNLRRLWQDLKAAITDRDLPGCGMVPTSTGSVDRPRSAAAIFDRIMLALAEEEGKSIWCEKTPMHVHHIGRLAKEFPRAKFIHVIRDGRDCAASFHRRWQFDPVRTAYRWRCAVQAGRAQGAALGSRYHEVRYEDVTTAPEEHFQEICAFLGVPFEETILKPARLRPKITGSSAEQVEPNARRAEQYFSRRTFRRIEAVAGGSLSEFGYDTFYSAQDQDPSWVYLRWTELLDDFRRLRGVAKTARTMRKRTTGWSYFSRRLTGALKQKRSLKM